MTKSRNLIAKKKLWTADENALLLALYPCTKTEALARLFNCNLNQVYKKARQFKLSKSQWFKDSPMSQNLRSNPEIGKSYRFKKGNVPPNKGKKCESHPNAVKTQFKPGQKPVNHLPPGSTRICSKQGYVLMKMAEGINQWRPIHRIIYKRMHGKVPAGDLVTFVDGNRQNISIVNLTTISKKQHVINNSLNRLSPDIAELYRIKGRITREINKRKRVEHEQRY